MAFHRYIVSDYFGNIDMGFRYRLNLNLNYQFANDYILEAFGNYNSAAKHSGKKSSVHYLYISGQKNVLE
jgi:hypothetical protein